MRRPALIRRILTFRRRDDGAAAIEAALAVPFMVTLGAGLIEFGSVHYNFELIQTGVRDAARYLAHVSNLAGSEGAARNLATTGSITAGKPARVKWWSAGQVQISYTTVPNPPDPATGLRQYRGGDPITVIRVSTSVPYAGLGLLSAAGLGPLTITAAHEERYVGQ